eukprot:14559743-Ditylum_brightwellii.AAC.1
MTLVQLDAPDLVRDYCSAKGLSMDGSAWSIRRKEVENKMDKKKKHKDTVNLSTYKCDIDHGNVGNFQQCTHQQFFKPGGFLHKTNYRKCIIVFIVSCKPPEKDDLWMQVQNTPPTHAKLQLQM